MARVFSIDEDLLGLASFLARGGGGQSQYGAGVWFLTEVSQQLKPKHIPGHIVLLAFDNIPARVLEAYCKYAVGLASLTPDTERFLRDRGFLYGEKPRVPKRVKTRCKWYVKHLYGEAV